MRINTNVMALNAQHKLTQNQGSVEKSIQRLSSGLRINRASDDASGLAISEKMRAQIRGLSQAQDNAQDGISLIQTAEGALQQTTDILQRMRELVIKAQNTGVLTDNDRTSISNELSTLRDEIDRIAISTTFNGKKLLDGEMATKLGSDTVAGAFNIDVSKADANMTYTISKIEDEKLVMTWTSTADTSKVLGTAYSDVKVTVGTSVYGKVTFAEAGITIDFGDKTSLTSAGAANAGVKFDNATISTNNTITTGASTKADFKIGANTYSEDILSTGIGNMKSNGLNRYGEAAGSFQIDISDAKKADETLKAIDYAIDKVSSQRSDLGVIQNRMEYAVSNLSTTEENLTAAESRIRDVDMAEEMVNYTKNSILNQSAMAMLAQANQQPQSILSLLQ